MALLTFDSAFYLQNNPDVLRAVADGSIPSAEWHYANYGWKELRDPSPNFDTSYYLTENQDVLAAGINPLEHFERWGAAEGRAPNANFVAADNFDADRYLLDNPDVVGSGLTAYQHYALYGWNEGRPAFTLAGEPVIGGSTADLNLTTNIETLNGTSGNDVFVAGLQGGVLGNLVNTLQTGDVLNGGAGQDTLRADITYNVAFEGPTMGFIAPTLNSVETVDVRFLGPAVLDLSRSTGVETINVHDSITGFEGESEGFAVVAGVKGATTFNVSNQDGDVDFLGGTAESITLNVANVGTGFGAEGDAEVVYSSLNDDLDAATVSISNSNVDVVIDDADLETLTVSVNGSSADVNAEGTVGELNLTVTNAAANPTEGSGDSHFTWVDADTIGSANLTLTNADVDLDASAETPATGEDVVATITAAVTGANVLSGDYVNVATSLTVTGEGSLDVESDLTDLRTLTATNAGGIVAGGLTTAAETVTTGAGNDSITFSFVSGGTDAVAGGASVDLGAGDDVLTIQGNIGVGTDDEGNDVLATLAGGAGTDTIVLSSAVAGDVVTEGDDANVSISGFEVLEISDLHNGTVDASQFGLNEVVLAAGFGAEAAAITGLESGAIVTLENGTAAGENELAIAVEGTDATDVVTINLSNAASVDFGNLVVTGADTINLNADSTAVIANPAQVFTARIDAADAETITITGDVAHLDLTGVYNAAVAAVADESAEDLIEALTVAAANADGVDTTVTTIDASALTGGITVAMQQTVDADTTGTTILGGQGDNQIIGSTDGDTITTQGGNDIIVGGLGADQITTGAGVDTLVYLSAADSSGLAIDTITDFQAGTALAAHDVFDFRALLSGQVVDVDLNFVDFIGNVNGLAAANTALSGSVSENLEVVFDISNNQLYADVNNDGQVNAGDLVVSLTGVSGLNDWNFLGLAPVTLG